VKKILKLQLVLGCAAALGAIAVLPSAPMFENNEVRVVRALEKAHVKGSFHEHTMNRVMVYLQSGRQRFEYQDGRKPAVLDWKPGQVVWSKPEGMHSPEVISDESFNIIEVELKNASAELTPEGSHDALKLDGKHYKLELANGQVRVLRLTLGAHQATPIVEHARNTVAIFLTDQETRTTDAKGTVDTAKHKAGDAVWQTPNTTKIENAGDAPLEMVLVELRS
jgi:oxalate decarboxylase/phosphoglucose isomerase-like protein (cupin superfamily)